MTQACASGERGVGKTQKSFHIDDDLIRLLEACHRVFGPTFTRQLNAALIQFFFDWPLVPAGPWLEMAAGLEAGDTTIVDIIRRQHEHAVYENKKADAIVESAVKAGNTLTDEALCRLLEMQDDAHNELFLWKIVLGIPGSDGAEKIIRAWSDWKTFTAKGFLSGRTQSPDAGADEK